MMATPVVHELKAWPGPFGAVLAGQKRHEIRSTADRTFTEGDIVILREWANSERRYTGRVLTATIGNVSPPCSWGLPADMCVFTLLDVEAMTLGMPATQPNKERISEAIWSRICFHGWGSMVG